MIFIRYLGIQRIVRCLRLAKGIHIQAKLLEIGKSVKIRQYIELYL